MPDSTEPRPVRDPYRTTDLSEASFLAARGHTARVDALNPQQAAFIFAATPELEESLTQFASGPHSVDVFVYGAMRDVLRKKAQIAVNAVRGGRDR